MAALGLLNVERAAIAVRQEHLYLSLIERQAAKLYDLPERGAALLWPAEPLQQPGLHTLVAPVGRNVQLDASLLRGLHPLADDRLGDVAWPRELHELDLVHPVAVDGGVKRRRVDAGGDLQHQ